MGDGEEAPGIIMHMGMHVMLFIMVDAVISRSSQSSSYCGPLPYR